MNPLAMLFTSEREEVFTAIGEDSDSAVDNAREKVDAWIDDTGHELVSYQPKLSTVTWGWNKGNVKCVMIVRYIPNSE